MEHIPDALKAAPKAYKLLMENERVRVLDIRLTPGQKAPMHNHPNDHVIYVINGAKVRLTSSDGKKNEFDLKAGQTIWMEAGSHEAENIGSTVGHNLAIELKK